jgi:hypothetical protein
MLAHSLYNPEINGLGLRGSLFGREPLESTLRFIGYLVFRIFRNFRLVSEQQICGLEVTFQCLVDDSFDDRLTGSDRP